MSSTKSRVSLPSASYREKTREGVQLLPPDRAEVTGEVVFRCSGMAGGRGGGVEGVEGWKEVRRVERQGTVGGQVCRERDEGKERGRREVEVELLLSERCYVQAGEARFAWSKKN